MSKARSPREVCSTTIGTSTELCIRKDSLQNIHHSASRMSPKEYPAGGENFAHPRHSITSLGWEDGSISRRKICSGDGRYERHRFRNREGAGRCGRRGGDLWPG